jgi:hypothetical protein
MDSASLSVVITTATLSLTDDLGAKAGAAGNDLSLPANPNAVFAIFVLAAWSQPPAQAAIGAGPGWLIRLQRAEQSGAV